jgi:hypothetical protein
MPVAPASMRPDLGRFTVSQSPSAPVDELLALAGERGLFDAASTLTTRRMLDQERWPGAN